MQEFWFYIQLGFNHVLDISAYDHVLFLAALAIPFSFKTWKKVLLLATIFTIAHCLSLTASVYELKTISASLIEFLIPITIILTALYNIYAAYFKKINQNFAFHMIITAFFGGIHGFGFSSYFKMLMTNENEKLIPLLGFATGIEASQSIIILIILLFIYFSKSIFQIKQYIIVIIISVLIIGITLPLLVKAYPQ